MRPYFLILALSPSLLLAACGGSTDSSNAASSAGGGSDAGAGGSAVSLGGAGGSANGGSAAGKGGTASLGMGGSATAGTGGSAAAGKGGSTPSTGGSSSAGTGGAPVGAGGMTPIGAGGESTGGGGETTGGGGTTAGSGGSPVGAGGASAGAGGSVAGAGGSSAGAGPCPSTPPTAGTSCVAPSPDQIPGAQCTYGDDVVGNCRQQFSCENGMWENQSTPSNCPAPGTMGCPATPPNVGDMCAVDDTTCGFPDGTICDCSACDGDVCMPSQQTTWHCVGPNTQNNCPAIVPNAGTPCSASQSELCTYGGCGGEGAMCTNGYWNWELLLCG